MFGSSELNLRVTMDSSQARAEARRLHEELSSRLQGGEVRHSGIWWAKQRGIKGLAQEPYRHQFFNERDAKYMGKQFAKSAAQELKTAGKYIGTQIATEFVNIGIDHYYGWAMVPGQNNRKLRRDEATAKGAMSGLGWGAGLAIAGLTALAPFTGGMSLGGVAAIVGTGAAVGAGAGAYRARDKAKISERDQDVIWASQFDEEDIQRRFRRRTSQSDMALQKQMELMPSRIGKLELIAAQIEQIEKGGGQNSIKELRKRRKAMLEGGRWMSHKYEKGALETTEGQRVLQQLAQQQGRVESLKAQQFMLGLQPSVGAQSAITDAYSRRGLFVGGQVDVRDTNRIIIENMKKIIAALEKVRQNTGEKRGEAAVFQ